MPPRTAEAADALSSVRREKLIRFSPLLFLCETTFEVLRLRLLQCLRAAAISRWRRAADLKCSSWDDADGLLPIGI